MMNEIFRNPEFIRHARAELRAPRMMISGGIALVICILIAMFHSQVTTAKPLAESAGPPEIAETLYFWLLCVQCVVLPLWCFSSSVQAIAGERQMKTYDFVRTTRMTSADILMGYLFGAPIMAYFTVGVSVVVSVLSGLSTGVPIAAMFCTYLFLVLFSLFVSLCGLLLSMVVEKPRAAGSLVIVVFLIWPATAFGFGAAASPFPGLAAFALVPGLIPLYKPTAGVPISAPFFGIPLPYLVLTVALYVSLGAWLVIALLRNLKREREEIQMLTRPQALGLAAYLNLLFLGFLDPTRHSYLYRDVPGMDNNAVMLIMLIMNQALFYIAGLATLSPPERLKVWYREHKAGTKSYFAEEGLPWPWMFAAGLIAFFCMALCGMRLQIGTAKPWTPGPLFFSVLVMLVFAVRDVMFLQWCMLTRMKNPISKGIGLLWLYYFAASLISNTFTVATRGSVPSGLAFLTPTGAWINAGSDAVIGGIILQTAVTAGILYLINERLGRMQTVAAT